MHIQHVTWSPSLILLEQSLYPRVFHRTLVITQMKRSKVADNAYVRKWPMHIFPMYVGYDS